MTLSDSGAPSSSRPLPASAYAVVTLQPPAPTRAPEFGFTPPRPIAGSPVPFKRDENVHTLMFILRNFYTRYKRWPANMTEVKIFADDTANFQPEFPETYEDPLFEKAAFTTNADGLTISYQHGTMTISKPK